jgi:AcrR family transcriptional regulator
VEHIPIDDADGTTARQELLSRVVEVFRRTGLDTEISLRTLAREIGSSHRMLSYHFGSRDGLLAAVLNELSLEQQRTISVGTVGWSRRDAVLAFWTLSTTPATDAQVRFFFYVFGLAAQEPGPYDDLARAVTIWVEELTELGVAEGRSADVAAAEARLIIACIRGLLIDVITSGDREAANRSLLRLLETLEVPEKQAATRTSRGRQPATPARP